MPSKDNSQKTSVCKCLPAEPPTWGQTRWHCDRGEADDAGMMSLQSFLLPSRLLHMHTLTYGPMSSPRVCPLPFPPPPPPPPLPASLLPPLSPSLPIATAVKGVITAPFLSLFFLFNHFHLLRQSSFCSLPGSQSPPAGILEASGAQVHLPGQDPAPGSLDLARQKAG